MPLHGRYPIGVAARLTGVSIETLRAWERRHGVVEPGREGGGRTYGDADIRKLRLLRELVEAGHSIGSLAALGDRELRAFAEAQRRTSQRASAPERDDSAVDHIWRALERFDVDAAEAALERLAVLLPAEALCLDVALPLLRRVGDAWSEGRLGVAHEHLVSGALRTLLGSLTRLLRPARPPAARRVVFAAMEGELHELGLLAGTLLAAAARLSPVYLGPNVPARDVVDAARWTTASAVVLAAICEPPGSHPARAVAEIARSVPAGVEVLVGGAKPERLASALKAGPGRWIPDLVSLSAELQRLAKG
jgi:DNA-binding transcriptional MerR regulator